MTNYLKCQKIVYSNCHLYKTLNEICSDINDLLNRRTAVLDISSENKLIDFLPPNIITSLQSELIENEAAHWPYLSNIFLLLIFICVLCKNKAISIQIV